MSRHVKLQAKKREAAGSGAAKRLRRDGIVPAVIYGATQDNYSIQVNAREFSSLLKQTSADNFLVDLQIEGAKEKTKLAMVQDMHQDPLSGAILHVDFHAVNENEPITATVPIELLGEAAGVKEGGLLDQQLYSIEVHCLPTALPDGFEADISQLAIGDALHIKDLDVPEGVEFTLDGDVMIASIAEPRLAEDEDEEVAAEGQPEVIGEKADDAEDEKAAN